MSENTKASLKDQVTRLESHLEMENPGMVGVVRSYRKLDRIAWRLGLLDRTESYATNIAWWPLISVLGTYSSGKSTFINNLLQRPLQKTGNQAVDDKFTVICYGPEQTPRVLPGVALDGDPRFPLYKISHEIDREIAGEGARLDSYLQLKTCDSEALRGKIVIDSPGFDADAQRTATLRITDHIIDISDLVLVFFDARHPEPGAMRDTLDYLVTRPLERPDFTKFMHILNQIDNAAREDNPEEVFAAWQRALAQRGLTAGRFYRIYDPAAAMPIADEHLQRRFESKRDEDMDEIRHRIEELEVERSYRIVGELEQAAKNVREMFVPRLRAARAAWRRRVLWYDAAAFGTVLLVLLGATIALGWWDGMRYAPPWLDTLRESPVLLLSIVVLVAMGAFLLHRLMRRLAGRAVLRRLRSDASPGEHTGTLARAFETNLRSWWPVLFTRPRGWGLWARRRLDAVLNEAHRAIRGLNDRYTDPSGRRPLPEPAQRARQPEALPTPAGEAKEDEAAEQPPLAAWSGNRFPTEDRDARRPRPH